MPGEDRQGCDRVILQVEPMRVPPLVGSRKLAWYVLGHPLPPEVDARASHWHHGLLASLLLHQGDGEEISLELEVGLDP